MEPEVIRKLRDALSTEPTEAQVVLTLSLIRKLLEHRKAPAQYGYLQFFCDWAFHVRVDRGGARQMLHHFDDWSPRLLLNEKSASDACRFYFFFRIHLELKALLRDAELPEPREDWWRKFLSCYFEIIADCPATSGANLGLKQVKEIAVERDQSASETRYYWKITFKAGVIKPLLIDPDMFFRLRPTHQGEPWLWKGPTAVMVGLPEGWMTDNEPHSDFQFSMYPVLHTRESAMKKSVFLYGKIVLKGGELGTMEAIAAWHEGVILTKLPGARFERLKPLEKVAAEEGQYPRSLFRVGFIDPSYRGPEFSLYIDSPKGVLLLVLLCPEGQESLYRPVLEWIGQNTLMMTRDEGQGTLNWVE
jgi:hypothetical protein